LCLFYFPPREDRLPELLDDPEEERFDPEELLEEELEDLADPEEDLLLELLDEFMDDRFESLEERYPDELFPELRFEFLLDRMLLLELSLL